MTRGISAAKSVKDLTQRRRDAEGMKPSGIPWIGDIPEGWEVGHLKNCFAKTFTGVWGDESGKNENTIVCYRIADFNFSKGIVSDEKLTKRSYHHSELDGKIVKKGDLLLEKSGGGDLNPVGRAVIVKYDMMATCSNFIQDLRCNEKHDELYVEYVLRALYFKGVNGLYYNQTIGIQNLQVGKYLSAAVAIPPLAEQKAIAAYLDEKCAAIDAAVAEAKKGIEEYKAWKKSLIFEAVTGKRRVGDFATKNTKCAKATPSGIPWIGDVPEGWEVHKTLFGLSMPITDGPHTTPELFDHGIPFVSAEAVSCGNGGIDFDHIRGYISEAFYKECCEKYIPQRDDIYMIKSGATTGRVSIVDTDRVFTIWSPLAVFRCNKNRQWSRYAFYYLQSSAYQGQVELAWSFGTQQNIGMRALEQLKFVAPPLAEQKSIADYLDERCAAIDALVAEKEALIADLEVYKKSLIFEVVTGKREVA